MSTVTPPRPANLDVLFKAGGKAELRYGRIVPIMPTGYRPGTTARRITRSLEDYAAAGHAGVPIDEEIGYGFNRVLPSGRQSLSPDTSYYTGPLPADEMDFVRDGAPVFAVEVRSKSDYGPTMDREYEEKRQDYYDVGTAVVWDVDPIAQTVTKYIAADPADPTVFRRGDVADAEPALPGWRLSVDDLFA